MEVDSGNDVALDGAEDAFLVARAVGGDLRGFTVLLRRYNRMLRRYIERLTRNPADTDDVLQETALAAWQRLGDLRDPSNVRSWLIQIATRQALRHLRGRAVNLELTEDISEIAGPDAGIEHLDLRQDLQVALDALPEQQAQCWTLRVLGGYSYSEIADELNIPESTVRGALALSRKRILHVMGGHR